jgi:hypothetical protein
MCAPRWDSDALFSTLIGGGGLYAITPTDLRFVWGGYYERDSLIWHSRWVTSTGIIECREALAFPADPRRGHPAPGHRAGWHRQGRRGSFECPARAHPVPNPRDMVCNWLDNLVRERHSDLGRCEYLQMKGGGRFELPR